jgi:hypothetical protein
MMGFATIFSDFTNISSTKAPVYKRVFAITFGIYTNLAFAI